MKKIVPVLLAYAAVIFGCGVGLSFLWGHLPNLIPSEVASYRWIRGCLWFLDILPAVLFTGLVCGLCVQWKDMGESSKKFSPASWKRFQVLFIVGLVMVLVLTLSQEIFAPAARKKLKVLSENPLELRKDLELAEYYLNHRNERLAVQYAEMAYGIDDENAKALYFYKKTHENMEQTLDELELLELQKAAEETLEKVEIPMEVEDSLFTTTELIRKSLDAAEAGDWFESHYYAVVAQKACAETDTNYAIATEAANLAWSKISNPSDFGNQEQKDFYYTKKRGYSALKSGDNLKAYYIFEGLAQESEEYANDPDVIRYLELARQRVENDYFFIDETDDLKQMEADTSIYFCMGLKGGGKKLVYIDRMATVRQSDGFVRYLDGFYVVEYAANGMLRYSAYVPFAKMVAVSTDTFSDEQLDEMGLSRKWKNVPLVKLQSVDRNTEGIVSRPKYAYVADGLPEEMRVAFGLEQMEVKGHGAGFFAESKDAQAERKSMLLELPMEDMDVVGQASGGPEAMNLLQLWKFVSKAKAYGFSQEVYQKALVTRCCFPLLVLVLIVLFGDFAWTVRLSGRNSVFRMRWILVMPFITVVFHFVLQTVMYVYGLLNLVFVAAAGEVALVLALMVYVAALVGSSLHFMGHSNS